MENLLLILLYLIGVAVSIFLLFAASKAVSSYVNFSISAIILGTIIYSHILPYYDNSMKLFSVMAFIVIGVGALVGGVFDLLEPKLSAGVSFGVLFSLLISTILLASQKVESEKTFGMVMKLFGIFTALGIFVAYYKFGDGLGDHKSGHNKWLQLVRLSLFTGLIFAISVDGFFNFGLIYALSDIISLRVTTIEGPCNALSEHKDGSPCHIMSMIVLWIMTTILTFFLRYDKFIEKRDDAYALKRSDPIAAAFKAAGASVGGPYHATPSSSSSTSSSLSSSSSSASKYYKCQENYFNIKNQTTPAPSASLESSQKVWYDGSEIEDILRSHLGMDDVLTVINILQDSFFRGIFGFQKDSLDNQGEHVFMLVCNESTTAPVGKKDHNEGGFGFDVPSEKIESLRVIHNRLFENYRMWCERVDVEPLLYDNVDDGHSYSSQNNNNNNDNKNNNRSDEEIGLLDGSNSAGAKTATRDSYYKVLDTRVVKKLSDKIDRKTVYAIVDVLLFFDVWGESGNIRHLPEMLCYLFHKSKLRLIDELNKVSNNTSSTTSTSSPSSPFSCDVSYLDAVAIPVYKAIFEERNKKTVDRKIYDDFNEFFWSPNCLNFDIYVPTNTARHISSGMRQAKKTYLEKRSWLHPLLSLNRLFEWHAVTFILLMACAFGQTLQWSLAFTVQVASSVLWFITLLHIFWTCLEVYVLVPGTDVSPASINGYILRLAVGLLTLVYQSIYFHWAFRTDATMEEKDSSSSPSLSNSMRSQGSPIFWWWQYVWLSLFTLLLYFIESITCLFPWIASSLMKNNNPYFKSLLGIYYPLSTLYVGKETHVPQPRVFEYTVFWLTLLAFKLWFGYVFVISPVVTPTIEIYDDYMNFNKISFIKVTTLVLIWWLPHFIVYLIDLSIFYAIWASVAGGIVALFERQGAVRDNRTFRKHFLMSMQPFYEHLIFPRELMLHDGAPESNISSSGSINSSSSAGGRGDAAHTNSYQKSSFSREVSSSGASKMRSRKSSVNLNEMMQQSSDSSPRLLLNEFSPANATAPPSFSGFDFYSNQDMMKVFGRVWNEIIDQLRTTDHISNEEKKNLKFFVCRNVPFSMHEGGAGTESIFNPLYISAGLFEGAIHQYTQFVNNDLFGWVNMSSDDRKAVILHLDKRDWDRKQLLERAFTENLDKNGDIPVTFVIKEVFNLTVWVFGNIFRTCGGDKKDNKALQSFNELVKLISDSEGLVQSHCLCKYIEIESIQKVLDKLVAFLSMKKDPEPAVLRLKVTEIFEDMKKLVRNHQKTDDRDRGGVSGGGNNTPFSNKIVDGRSDDLSRFISAIIDGIKALPDDFMDKFRNSTSKQYADIFKRICDIITKRTYEVEIKSSEARRRMNFFINSLFMTIPYSKNIQKCREYSVLTPHYSETAIYSVDELDEFRKDKNGKSKNSDVNREVHSLLYLRTLYKDDWANFLERKGVGEDAIWSEDMSLETRIWASLRGQTLFRTVEGMMYTEKAIGLYCELEKITDPKTVADTKKFKFNYVVACQLYGQYSESGDSKGKDIEIILERHRNIRVAYLEKVEVGEKACYSVLVKYDVQSTSKNKIGVVYKIKLPGDPFQIGEGKPENQNHAIVFTRGRYLQAIDMNQDGYFEESLKFKNLLEEFSDPSCAILGFREHIFTGTESNVANYLALQELSFVTLGQRVLHRPLCVRQHYGHPDFFDKFFVMTQGGMSKASRSINLSEDVFAGYNATIRGKFVKFKEYCQIGKGRDQSLQAIYQFEGKLSQGNAEQSVSRDINRIAGRLDFFRLLSFYYGGIGHYISNTVIMIALIVVTYSMVALALFYEEGVDGRPIIPEGAIQILLSGLGIVQTLPLVVTLTVEKGFLSALLEIVLMILSGGPLYFIFHIQTKCYNFQKVLMSGNARYESTGRGFVKKHFKFDVNFRFFGYSHIGLGVELMVALLVFLAYSQTTQYFGLTWSLWLTVVAFILGPFWFNPNTFDFSTVKQDYELYNRWMFEPGGKPEQSWSSWFKEEVLYLKTLSRSWKIVLFFQRCGVWAIVGVGLLGGDFFSSRAKQIELFHILILLVVFLLGNHILWLVENNNHYDLSYGIRRFAGVILNSSVFLAAVIMYSRYHYLLRYSISVYYFGSVIAYIFLLNGEVSTVIRLYQFHDYIICHGLFLIISVLTLLQIGHVQQWLLYYNTLSKGVVMDDILKDLNNSGVQMDTIERKINKRMDDFRTQYGSISSSSSNSNSNSNSNSDGSGGGSNNSAGGGGASNG